jgi:hypothetical protein
MQFLLSATLAESINNRSTALTGAARTQLANPLTFKASGAAAAFWSFSAAGKGLGPRGYERAINPIIPNRSAKTIRLGRRDKSYLN